MLKPFILLPILLFLAGCTSTPQRTSPEISRPPVADDSGRIDYDALQSHLGLDRSPEDLGYSERSFNTCEAGYGFSRSQNCHTQHFVVVHFQLMCRDSEGTISTILTDADLTPISRKSVRWNLKGLSGTVQTDGEGYGQIRITSRRSQKNERIKLAIANDFLYTRAGEIKRIITPRPWCFAD